MKSELYLQNLFNSSSNRSLNPLSPKYNGGLLSYPKRFLKNVIALHERAEDYAKIKREFFDVTTARAVARLNILSELCLPLTKVGGYFIAMKGQGGNEEIKEAFKGIEILGGHVEKVISLELPDNAGARDIIIIKKIKETPKKYPRAFAKIKERPL